MSAAPTFRCFAFATYLRARQDLKLDTKALSACIASSKPDGEIVGDMAAAKGLGITGTPTFVLGRTLPNGGVEGPVIAGAVAYTTFDAKLNAALAGLE